MELLKKLMEQRNDMVTELENLIGSAKEEKRALSPDEQSQFAKLETDIANIDATIDMEERARKFETGDKPKSENDASTEERATFEAFLRGREYRADVMSTTENGNIIPSEFSNDIIRRVTELSGVFSAVSRISAKGTYKQIIEANKITAGWTAELAEVQKSAATFDLIEIGHHKLGALVKLSYEIINQSEFPIIPEVTSQMIQDFTAKVEAAIINGDGNGMPLGLMTGGTRFNLASATETTADEIVKVYHQLKAPFIRDAVWILSRQTLCNVRLLKDGIGRFLFHEGTLTDGYVGYILGRPVLISEEMADNTFLFGDYRRAYKANVNPQMSIQMLNELYAPQGAKGVLGFLFLDGRPVNNEAYVVAQSASTRKTSKS